MPAGAVAIIDSTPVGRASYEHWLPIAGRGAPAAAARRKTVSFLVKAQWLIQEAEAEGIDHSVLAARVANLTTGAPPHGMTRADQAFQARLDVIAEALDQRHGQARGGTGHAALARYYAGHRSEFSVPTVRRTKMVITTSRAEALKARAAIAGGMDWSAAAKRFSIDASASIGGDYAVVAGISPAALVHAAANAPPGRTVGPLAAAPTAGTRLDWYLFKLTSVEPTRRRSLAEATPEIRQTLEEEDRHRAVASFEHAFVRRWRARTLCAPGFVVGECRNHR